MNSINKMFVAAVTQPAPGRVAGLGASADPADSPTARMVPGHDGFGARRWERRLIAWGLHHAIRLARKGRVPLSRRIVLRLAAMAPDVPVVQFCLANFALAMGDTIAAKRAIKAAVDGVSSHRHRDYCRAAILLLQLQDLDAAASCLETARGAFPASPRLWVLLGELHRYRANADEAVRCFERAFALATIQEERLRALVGLADSFADSGRRDEAVSAYRRMVEIAPGRADAYTYLIDCQKGAKPSDDLVQSMINMLSSNSIDKNQRMSLHDSLGKVYDDCGQYGEAFAHLTLGNLIRAQFVGRFDVPLWKKAVEDRISVFNPQRIGELSEHGCHDDFLICVVGMPRSGTTLVEQILSSHPDVAGLGERLEFQRVTRGLRWRLGSRLPYPECCARLTPRHVRELSDSVRDELLATAGRSARVVTKLPEDFWDLGLIRILFPRARFVHCRRHPIDTCLSCYMQDFAGLAYATDLAVLAEVYRLYRRIMRHWQEALPPGSIFECSYERMVSDPEPLVRSLHEFCGLPYNEDWSRFSSHARRVDTASKWQVRRPIYRSSVERWRNYAALLGPLLELEEE